MEPLQTGLKIGDKTVGILDKLLGPWFTRRQADANTHAALQEALTHQVATYMEAHPNDPVIAEALMSCHGRFGFENILRIAQLAAPQLDEDARPDLISDNWGANYKDKAYTCSDPDMVQLWAQLLAAEANNPGSYSKKTVNVLADLEPDDARLFRTLCDFRLIPTDLRITVAPEGTEEIDFRRAPLASKLVVLDEQHPLYTGKGITFDSLARLEWLGLIRYVSTQYGEVRRSDVVTRYEHGHGQLFLSYQGTLPLGVAQFVPAGTQLADLCTPLETPDGFIEYLTEFWKGRGVRVVHTLPEIVGMRS